MRCSLLPVLGLALSAQPPTFEVASIRLGNRTNTGNLCRTLQPSSDSVILSAVWPLTAALEDAYQEEVDDFDHPQWSRAGNFAFDLKVPPNTSISTCRKMLQALLAERFHMAVAVETRDVARYYLKVAKSGIKLKPANSPGDPATSAKFVVEDGNIHYSYRGAPMSRILDSIRPSVVLNTRARSLRETGSVNDAAFRYAAVNGLVDETGLSGVYDGEFAFAPADSDELAESLEDALTRQLGLTLERRRAPGKVLVILSSDRTPTEN